jgi:hypothetical protein
MVERGLRAWMQRIGAAIGGYEMKHRWWSYQYTHKDGQNSADRVRSVFLMRFGLELSCKVDVDVLDYANLLVRLGNKSRFSSW